MGRLIRILFFVVSLYAAKCTKFGTDTALCNMCCFIIFVSLKFADHTPISHTCTDICVQNGFHLGGGGTNVSYGCKSPTAVPTSSPNPSGQQNSVRVASKASEQISADIHQVTGGTVRTARHVRWRLSSVRDEVVSRMCR